MSGRTGRRLPCNGGPKLAAMGGGLTRRPAKHRHARGSYQPDLSRSWEGRFLVDIGTTESAVPASAA